MEELRSNRHRADTMLGITADQPDTCFALVHLFETSWFGEKNVFTFTRHNGSAQTDKSENPQKPRPVNMLELDKDESGLVSYVRH